eukprot:353751-Chlamydomonas_euryale.AAC.2
MSRLCKLQVTKTLPGRGVVRASYQPCAAALLEHEARQWQVEVPWQSTPAMQPPSPTLWVTPRAGSRFRLLTGPERRGGVEPASAAAGSAGRRAVRGAVDLSAAPDATAQRQRRDDAAELPVSVFDPLSHGDGKGAPSSPPPPPPLSPEGVSSSAGAPRGASASRHTLHYRAGGASSGQGWRVAATCALPRCWLCCCCCCCRRLALLIRPPYDRACGT